MASLLVEKPGLGLLLALGTFVMSRLHVGLEYSFAIVLHLFLGRYRLKVDSKNFFSSLGVSSLESVV